jgi:hypothetical protein
MISVKANTHYRQGWLAFPGLFVRAIRFYFPFEDGRLLNKPGLEHWFVLVDSNPSGEDVSESYRMCYPSLSLTYFTRYTIISARTQGMLNKDLSYNGVYLRDSFFDHLAKLKWVPAKFRWANYASRVINSMDSPILLFDESYLSGVARNWCSAFVSFLSDGHIIVSVSYHVSVGDHYGSFYLGQMDLSSFDLLKS